MEIIESRQNKAVKYARSLYDKKFRDKEGLFIAEGLRCLEELAKSGQRIEMIFYSQDPEDSSRSKFEDERAINLLKILKKLTANKYPVSKEIMEYLSPVKTSQKILTVAAQKKWDAADVFQEGKYFVAIYRIDDPGNMGTIIRSAAAFECSGIILVGDCVDIYNPKVVRSSAGYIFRTPVIDIINIDDYFNFAESQGIKTVGFSPCGKSDFSRFSKETACYFFGGETYGLGEDYEEKFKELVRIPMSKNVESLNLAVCASIVMEKAYENIK